MFASLQSVEKAIGNADYVRLYGLDGTALERLVDEPAKPTMLGIVVTEHVQRQEPDGPGQESQDARLRPDPRVVRVAREGLVLLQQERTGIMSDREPCPADDGKFQADDRRLGAHPVKRRERISMKARRQDVELV
jgi:hypothetical protein